MITHNTTFSLSPVPAIRFGAGSVQSIANDAQSLSANAQSAVFMVDGPLHDLGVSAPVIESLEKAGLPVSVFADIAGEPSEVTMGAATDFIRAHSADVVIAMGGGSALDIAKTAALIAATDGHPIDYACSAKPLPKEGKPLICIPTTAGTGSEASSTNVFQRADGRKVWVWGPETKPDIIVLDPAVTVSLPAHLTAWTGLDAFVHALESCTNRNATPGNNLYAHQALRLIAGALATAVSDPNNLAARGQMLLGSCFAGVAIDNAGVAMAHNISHALAALEHVHHGLATAIGMVVVFDWQIETDDGAFANAASACGLDHDPAALRDWYMDMMSRLHVTSLPPIFAQHATDNLVREMLTPETTPMRDANVRSVSESDTHRFAAATLAMTEGVAA